MKLDEIEAFRAEEERLLTPELGPEKAREQAQVAADARLANLDEEIREQLRSDLAQAREKRLGLPKRYRRDSGEGEDGVAGVSLSSSTSLRFASISSLNVNYGKKPIHLKVMSRVIPSRNSQRNIFNMVTMPNILQMN